jgi:hypothetical protein
LGNKDLIVNIENTDINDNTQSGGSDDDIRDVLPDDLNAKDFVGPHQFPNNSRRRIPGAMYLFLSLVCLILWLVFPPEEAVLVNDGILLAAVLLAVAGLISITSGWRMRIDEKEALVLATSAVGFTVGHASAQQVWRGLRSKPTWRILCYSAEEPPRQRGLVLVDAVDGSVYERLVEANPDVNMHDGDDPSQVTS